VTGFLKRQGGTSSENIHLSYWVTSRAWSVIRRGLVLASGPEARARGCVHVANNLAEAAMHWRKAPSRSNGRVFYAIIAALFASVILTTALLILHFHT
jgi:hypothetical protein